MSYELKHLLTPTGKTLVNHWTAAELRQRIRHLLLSDGPRYRRLWAYYRNLSRACGVDPADAGSGRPYRQAQEWGLPSRITGERSGTEIFGAQAVEGVARKEVVIENDIGWRIDTLVDYLFGKPIVINSAAADPNRRAMIERLLRQVLARHGGIVFLQQLALLGAVYGFVDVLVKFDAEGCGDADLQGQGPSEAASESMNAPCGAQDLGEPPASESRPDGRPPSDGGGAAQDGAVPRTSARAAEPATGPDRQDDDSAATAGASHPSPEAPREQQLLDRLARRVRLEIVEPARALPLLSPQDYRCVQAYAQVYEMPRSGSSNGNGQLRAIAKRTLLERLLPNLAGTWSGGPLASSSDRVIVTELITADRWQRYEDERLVDEGVNSLGVLPLVHVQNTALPFEYAGSSDVEPLIGMQDELNTRLSDRAYRITMQSFKMYLGKGIENFEQMPVAPGRMWVTDNEQAEIIEFGGDGKTFSEDNHILGLREAMDKISGVTPIAAGAIKGRIGRLTSAAALRVTMLALLAKTERKRTAYGRGIEQICELALAWLDRSGLLPTTPQERRIEIHWPSPIPVNELERLQEAQAKVQLGVPHDIVLRELGY
jgi:hypothetical protein